jgi:hypothetical protein
MSRLVNKADPLIAGILLCLFSYLPRVFVVLCCEDRPRDLHPLVRLWSGGRAATPLHCYFHLRSVTDVRCRPRWYQPHFVIQSYLDQVNLGSQIQ